MAPGSETMNKGSQDGADVLDERKKIATMQVFDWHSTVYVG